ncbi:hypothetical protein [Sandarakinorhabdus cyanobacteriorum]|uniref:hypothetical protein n=1 Tax=Sandarakinorhabdus cyanobacteriorum TaxID=1981098 RepID=UPI0010562FD0|nr:hypothetical protein [Sandarakinorhabdus cyanobacteriorum]
MIAVLHPNARTRRRTWWVISLTAAKAVHQMFHMQDSLPDEFLTDLVIGLRMISQSPRRDYASRLTLDRDRGSARIAASLMEHLQRCGYKIEPPPSAPMQMSR